MSEDKWQCASLELITSLGSTMELVIAVKGNVLRVRSKDSDPYETVMRECPGQREMDEAMGRVPTRAVRIRKK